MSDYTRHCLRAYLQGFEPLTRNQFIRQMQFCIRNNGVPA